MLSKFDVQKESDHDRIYRIEYKTTLGICSEMDEPRPTSSLSGKVRRVFETLENPTTVRGYFTTIVVFVAFCVAFGVVIGQGCLGLKWLIQG